MKTWQKLASAFLITCLAASCATPLHERKMRMEDLRRLGEAHIQEGNYTAALKTLLEAEQVYSEEPELHNALGLTYMGKERYDLAVGHFKKAITLKSDYTQAKNNLGATYLSKGDWDSAIPYFKEASEDLTYETPHYAFYNLGQAYYNKKNFALARQYYERALKYSPRFVAALRGLALTEKAFGRIREAVAVLERATTYAPQIPQLYLDLAELYTVTGNRDKALGAYGKVIELAPDSPLAIEAEKRMPQLK